MIETTNESFSAMNQTVKALGKSWHALSQTEQSWNLKNVQTHCEKLRPLIASFPDSWAQADHDLTQLTEAIKAKLNSPSYATELEEALQSAGVNFSGSFPLYMLPPFKLTINPESCEARLSLGRKNERCADLNPRKLAQWVSIRYKKLQARKFNAQGFMKDLLEAYQIAHRLQHPSQGKSSPSDWGHAVSIFDIYSILTIKASTRQDYPRQFFIYDLGLLKENSQLTLNSYRFELGPERHQSRALVVVDSSGRESYIGSLTIYNEED